jgi:hypothetical protein
MIIFPGDINPRVRDREIPAGWRIIESEKIPESGDRRKKPDGQVNQ